MIFLHASETELRRALEMKPTNLITLGIFAATLTNPAPKLTAYKLVYDIFVLSFNVKIT
jgi:hypothetical protein